MTVQTNFIADKKADKLEDPLVKNEPSAPNVDLEATTEQQYFIRRTRVTMVSTAKTVCLFLTALLVMIIGVTARPQRERFTGCANIPYDGTNTSINQEDQFQQNGFNESLINFFKEEFELDLDADDYERIDVPEFSEGRRGRFIHDLNSNKTGIVDQDNQRCFVMPLNRQQVLPPKSLYDLLHKMWEGYYDVDMEVVRETMRVVVPPITDRTTVGHYISRDCKSYPIYLLEKVEQPAVYKRSVLEGSSFAEFAGKNLMQFDIVNINEVDEYEGKHHQVSV